MTLSYEHAVSRLLARPTRPKFGLERMARLLAAVGAPQTQLRIVHVAGTKGKGSVSAMVDAMCRAHGWRSALTQSPHLNAARERIVVNGTAIDEAGFCALEARIDAMARTLDDEPSFFECMIAMALLHFCNERVDVAVVEVGMGGRLDATNVVTPAVCGITAIGLDHQAFLGNSIEAIAREKAGILKPHVPAFALAQTQSVVDVFTETAARVGAPLVLVSPDEAARLQHGVGLRGAHQRENAALAAALARHLGVSEDAIAAGARDVQLLGRYQRIKRGQHHFVLDGAHNAMSAAALHNTLAADGAIGAAPALMWAMTEGHDPDEFLRSLWPSAVRPAVVHVPQLRSPRAQARANLCAAARRVFGDQVRVCAHDHVEQALDACLTGNDTDVVVTGSLYLVGEALHAFGVGLPPDIALPLF